MCDWLCNKRLLDVRVSSGLGYTYSLYGVFSAQIIIHIFCVHILHFLIFPICGVGVGQPSSIPAVTGQEAWTQHGQLTSPVQDTHTIHTHYLWSTNCSCFWMVGRNRDTWKSRRHEVEMNPKPCCCEATLLTSTALRHPQSHIFTTVARAMKWFLEHCF